MLAEKTRRDADVASAASPDRDSKGGTRRRDLVVVNPVETIRKGRSRLTDALFLAHMFATKFQAPQTREKRRAEPGDANASYRKAKQAPVKTGRIVSKKV